MDRKVENNIDWGTWVSARKTSHKDSSFHFLFHYFSLSITPTYNSSFHFLSIMHPYL